MDWNPFYGLQQLPYNRMPTGSNKSKLSQEDREYNGAYGIIRLSLGVGILL